MSARYEARGSASGWVVVDTASGEVVAAFRRRGLSRAAQQARALGRAKDMNAAECRTYIAHIEHEGMASTFAVEADSMHEAYAAAKEEKPVGAVLRGVLRKRV